MFALVDCNNFYASCERLFAPELRHRPIVVLSNNDGCVVARSNEAKALGIPMAAPWFKVRQKLQQHQVAVFSSNYELYGDLSTRVMQTLSGLCPAMEVYSIDEAFLDLSGLPVEGLSAYAKHIRDTTSQWTGIPVSVGIAPSKTLAKVASYISKKSARLNGAYYFPNDENHAALLERIPVAAVWGVGRRWAKRLQGQGIHNAKQLRDLPLNHVRAQYSVVLARTVRELRGEACVEVEAVPPMQRQIINSRSFPERLVALYDVRQAVTHFVSRAAHKMRRQGLLAGRLDVVIRTSPFHPNEPYHKLSKGVDLAVPTSHTGLLLSQAMMLLEQLFRPGLCYQKAGVVLSQLLPQDGLQRDMFHQLDSAKGQALMKVMDQINQRMGKGTIHYATEGFGGKWVMRQAFKSPAYTTCWQALKQVS